MSNDFKYPCVIRELSSDGCNIELWYCVRSDLRCRVFSDSFPLSEPAIRECDSLIAFHTKSNLPAEHHLPFYDNLIYLKYRVWPDATVQCTEDGMPHDWLPDNYKVVEAASEAHALIIAGLSS